MNYILHILITINIYSILAVSMNMLLGYLGILYLAHPAIYGIGAYTFAILTLKGVNFFIALLAAGFSSMLASFILSLPALKLKSHYVGMSTLAFLMIVFSLFINLKDLTRGALGIPGIPRPEFFHYNFNSSLGYFLLTLTISVIILILLHRILKSPWSKVVEAIREDETAAKTLGKNIKKYKIQAFLITGFVGGIGGGLLACFLGFINPWNFAIEELMYILAMVVVGGMGSFWGSIVGVIIIVLLPEPLRFLDLPSSIVGQLRYAIYGLLIILFMIFRPNGILGKRTNIFSK